MDKKLRFLYFSVLLYVSKRKVEIKFLKKMCLKRGRKIMIQELNYADETMHNVLIGRT